MNAILIIRGTMLHNMTLSSRNSLSVRTHLPVTRISMMTSEKMVHHQLTIKVGFNSILVRAAGAWLSRRAKICGIETIFAVVVV